MCLCSNFLFLSICLLSPFTCESKPPCSAQSFCAFAPPAQALRQLLLDFGSATCPAPTPAFLKSIEEKL